MWGSAPFQSLYQGKQGALSSLLLLPEWYLVNSALAALSAMGALWTPLLLAIPLLIVSAGLPLVNCILSATQARFATARQPGVARLKLQVLTTFLHVIQPFARLCGRLKYGPNQWRRSVALRMMMPRSRQFAVWSETWIAPEERLKGIEAALRSNGELVRRGGDFDGWDLEVRGGVFGASRLLMAVEDHGAGTQFVRSRCWPKLSALGIFLVLWFAVPALGAGLDGAFPASGILGGIAGFFILQSLRECGLATSALLCALKEAGQTTGK